MTKKLEGKIAVVTGATQVPISLYLEGALSPADQRRFELHMSKCEGCKVYIDQIRLTIKAAGQLTEDSLGPAAKEELLAAFRDWKKGQFVLSP